MTTPITPEMLRACAEVVGYDAIIQREPILELCDVVYVIGNDLGTTTNIEWNPAANAEQDRMLDDYLLAHGWHVESCNAESHLIWRVDPPQEVTRFKFDCPRNEFRTRAVYAVVTRKEK